MKNFKKKSSQKDFFFINILHKLYVDQADILDFHYKAIVCILTEAPGSPGSPGGPLKP